MLVQNFDIHDPTKCHIIMKEHKCSLLWRCSHLILNFIRIFFQDLSINFPCLIPVLQSDLFEAAEGRKSESTKEL